MTSTSRAADVLACPQQAVAEATRLTGVADLRAERGMMAVPNGVIERFFGSLKYEHRYGALSRDGDALSVEVSRFRQVYNTSRPYQALDDRTPHAAYLAPQPYPMSSGTSAGLHHRE